MDRKYETGGNVMKRSMVGVLNEYGVDVLKVDTVSDKDVLVGSGAGFMDALCDEADLYIDKFLVSRRDRYISG